MRRLREDPLFGVGLHFLVLLVALLVGSLAHSVHTFIVIMAVGLIVVVVLRRTVLK